MIAQSEKDYASLIKDLITCLRDTFLILFLQFATFLQVWNTFQIDWGRLRELLKSINMVEPTIIVAIITAASLIYSATIKGSSDEIFDA